MKPPCRWWVLSISLLAAATSIHLVQLSFAAGPNSRRNNILDKKAVFSSCALDHYTVITPCESGAWPYRQYISSNARPPQLHINRTGEALSPGLIFISPAELGPISPGELPAALILTDHGDLIWSSDTANSGRTIANFQPQMLRGKPVITYWNGTSSGPHGYGAVEVVDDRYEKIHSICPQLSVNMSPPLQTDCVCDQHEALITANDTILVIVYNRTVADLSVVGGPSAAFVLDSLLVEVDPITNEVGFVWSPLQHVPVSETRVHRGRSGEIVEDPFDWFHMNSIDVWDGGYLINSRHTWTTYYVLLNGDVEWQIDGVEGGDFGPLPEGAHFASLLELSLNENTANKYTQRWQHDARLSRRSNNSAELTVFANNWASNIDTAAESVALSLLLAIPPDKLAPPIILRNLSDSVNPIMTRAGGSNLILPNGNYFVGYGKVPLMKEFGPAQQEGSDLRWSARFAYSVESYRAYKREWHATPATHLDLVIRAAAPHDLLIDCALGFSSRGFVSWNGATDITHYAVYVGIGEGEMVKHTTIPRMGFETEFVVPDYVQRVQVAALEGPSNHEVGRSCIVSINL